jgi:hypothetical protein
MTHSERKSPAAAGLFSTLPMRSCGRVCVLLSATRHAASPKESATGDVQLASARRQSSLGKQACVQPGCARRVRRPTYPSIPSSACVRERLLSSAALTQYLPHFSDGKNGKKVQNARTNRKFRQFVFIEPRHAVDRHLRFLGEALDGGSLMD